MSKASEVLARIEVKKRLTPGEAIMWPIYCGANATEAKRIEDYIRAFFMTGTLLPMHVDNLCLDILSLQTEYDDGLDRYLLCVEGVIRELPSM